VKIKIVNGIISLLSILLLLSSCGGLGRKDLNDNYSNPGSFDNTVGFYVLTLYVAMFETLFNMNELPFSGEDSSYLSRDLSIFDEFYEKKKRFEVVNFKIDSVFIDFCAKDQYVANGNIDNLNILTGGKFIDDENVIFRGKISQQFKYGSLQGSGVITINSESMGFNSHSFSSISKDEKYNAIELTANASFKQFGSASISADNAIMTAFCSLNYAVKNGDIPKIKNDFLLLNFVKDDDFWRFDSADKNLVELLEDLDKD